MGKIASLEPVIANNRGVIREEGAEPLWKRLDYIVDRLELKTFDGIGFQGWVEDLADKARRKVPDLAVALLQVEKAKDSINRAVHEWLRLNEKRRCDRSCTRLWVWGPRRQ